ncbi:MAG: GntR family transcriptional regulator [Spirochaetales bacterium]|nr:GntR family transcriptional regulator [Spirochaetales bacterium]
MIEHFTKSELVFNQLRDMIFSGELKPGEKVSAIDIATRMGVSRTPVNEAVKRLSDRNLVSILPNVGFQITVLPWEDILDLMELKVVIESTALRWIRDRQIPVDTGPLFELNSRILEALHSGNRTGYQECVRQYHLKFIAAARSKPLSDSFIVIWDYSGWEDTRLQELTDNIVDQCREHEAMLNCLKNKDFETALKISADHGRNWIDLFRRNYNGFLNA